MFCDKMATLSPLFMPKLDRRRDSLRLVSRNDA
jgi:hypothetical protein